MPGKQPDLQLSDHLLSRTGLAPPAEGSLASEPTSRRGGSPCPVPAPGLVDWGYVPISDVLGVAKVVYSSWDSGRKRVRWERIGHTLH